MQRLSLIGTGCVLAGLLAAGGGRAEPLKDLYFGEALYFANQGLYFEALERLDTEVRQHSDIDEPELDSLFHHINAAEFSLATKSVPRRFRKGPATHCLASSSLATNVKSPRRAATTTRLSR